MVDIIEFGEIRSEVNRLNDLRECGRHPLDFPLIMSLFNLNLMIIPPFLLFSATALDIQEFAFVASKPEKQEKEEEIASIVFSNFLFVCRMLITFFLSSHS